MIYFTFFLHFMYRVGSGIQNALGYAKEFKYLEIYTKYFTPFILLSTVSLTLINLKNLQDYPINIWLSIGGICCLILSIGSFIFLTVDFIRDDIKGDIHLTELVATTAFTLALTCLGFDIIALCCSMYPALVLHKIVINLGGGFDPLYEGTDDKTGRTFGIPSLGISIPRLNFKYRFILTGISMILWIVISGFMKKTLNIYDILYHII